jgi:hypothetical protein
MDETRRYLVAHTAERAKVAAPRAGLTESVVSEAVKRSRLFLDDLSLNMESVRFFASEDISSGKMKGVTLQGLEAFLSRAVDTTALREALGAS